MERRGIGHLVALFTILNWGTTFIATKIMLQAFTPVEILVFRFAIGVLSLYLICPRPLRGTNRRQELLFAAAGLTGACLYFLLENIALSYTTAANAGVIVAAAPLFTALFTWGVEGRSARPSAHFFVGFVIAMAGICLISLPSFDGVSLRWRGDLLALGAAMLWGLYCVLVKGIGAFGYNLIQTTRRTFLYGLIFMVPFVWLMDFRLGLERFLNPTYLGTMLYLGVGACAVCFVTWSFAVRILGPVKTCVYLYLSPVVTMVCSILILRERPSPAALVGAALTLAGLIVSQWDTLKGLFAGRHGGIKVEK